MSLDLLKGRAYLPIQKVDRARRMVWGTATIEEKNPDSQGDIVDFDASVRAFRDWIGNVREMHDTNAVGKCVEVIADRDSRRISVGIHISQGAEDTWRKVLDGTLRGFSIGGKVVKAVREYAKDLGRDVRRIKEYVLDELSLVDSPANARCTITAIEKRNGALVPTRSIGGPRMRNRVESLNNYVKELTAGEEVLVIKKSDVTVLEDGKGGKTIVLKSNGKTDVIRKEDLEQDGYGMDASAPDNDGDGDDVQETNHPQALMKCHDMLHKAAGERCDCETDPEVHTAAPAVGAAGANGAPNFKEIAAGRGLANGGANALEKKLDALTTQVGDIVKSLSQAGKEGEAAAVLVRKGNEGGGAVVQERTGDTAVEVAPADTKDGYVQAIEKQLGTLYDERKALINKVVSKVALQPEESVRRDTISDQIARLEETRSGLLTGKLALAQARQVS